MVPQRYGEGVTAEFSMRDAVCEAESHVFSREPVPPVRPRRHLTDHRDRAGPSASGWLWLHGSTSAPPGRAARAISRATSSAPHHQNCLKCRFRALCRVCYMVGDRHLAILFDQELKFRKALLKLGYALPGQRTPQMTWSTP